METSRNTARRAGRALLIAASVALLCIGLFAAVLTLGSARKNTCFQEGPSSPQALVSENSDTVHRSLSFWPLGRRCDWAKADGNGTVTTYSGNWASSGGTYGAIGLGIAGLVLAIRRRAPRGTTGT